MQCALTGECRFSVRYSRERLALTTLERQELAQLRRENKRLEMEREILKAAAVN